MEKDLEIFSINNNESKFGKIRIGWLVLFGIWDLVWGYVYCSRRWMKCNDRFNIIVLWCCSWYNDI